MQKPTVKPLNPNFSSGPCSKRPGYSLANLPTNILGRSHRSKLGKSRLNLSVVKTKEILGLPEDYRVGIVPASDTGAFEMAMWSMLGPRPVDVFYWESFGKGWCNDIQNELKLTDVNVYAADYGKLPDLTQANPKNDTIFAWNGTTSGVRTPNADWISDDREGLVFCDATSAVFAMEIPWEKLDVITYSWQKVLGGEGAHGMLILSPRAVKRLESYKPAWPMPKIFRMVNKGKLNEGIFDGATINTPSMIANEDYIDALEWTESIGGRSALMKRADQNLAHFASFVAKHEWINFLCADATYRSNTSVCLTIDLDKDKLNKMVALLDQEDVAYDCKAYKESPLGLRFWCGGTRDPEDVAKLLPWLEWALSLIHI